MKRRLDIPAANTAFDDVIDQFVLDGVSRLSPTVYHQVPVQEKAVTPSNRGEVNVDIAELTTPLIDVRSLEASAGDGEWPVDLFSIHATNLRVRELTSDVRTLFIYGLDEFTLTNVPGYLRLPVIYFGLSEFFIYLVADKAKYNVYMQNGRAAVDNMRDLVDFWEQKAIEYLEDKGTPYGR